MVAIVMAWSLGISIWQTEYLSIEHMGYLLPLSLLILIPRYRLPLFVFCLGMLWGALSLLFDARQIHLTDDWLHQPTLIEADIVHIQGIYPKRLTLNHVQRQDQQTIHGNIWLYTYQNKTNFRVGQHIQTTVKLHRPRNHQNPAGFDFKAYCFVHHISALGHSVANTTILAQPTSVLIHMRERIIERLASLPNESRGVLQALLLADRQHIPLHIQDAFSASGAAHLLAISGLHMGMLSAWMVFLCWWILTRYEVSIVRLPVRGICLLAALTACLFYGTLAAWPIPAQRAVLMLAIFVLAWWLRQRHQGLHTLGIAWIVILCFDPSSIHSVSLWLSFVAAGALITWSHSPTYAHNQHHILSLFWVSFICFFATLAFVIHAFSRFPVYSLLSNLLLVPLFSLWILPLALLGEVNTLLDISSLADLCFQGASYGLNIANSLLLWFYTLPAGHLWVAEINPWVSASYCLCLIVAASFWWHTKPTYACLTLCLSTLIYTLLLIAPSTAPTQWIAWDVGQGAAATYITPQGHVLHIDVPGKPNQRFNGGTTVASGLRHFGITHLKALVLSHAQQDHIGGALRLIDQLNDIEELWLADIPLNRQHPLMQRIIQKATQHGTIIRWLSQGQHIHMGETKIHVLWPPQGFQAKNHNQLSLVLSITEGSNTFLIAGDIEKKVEKTLLDSGISAHQLLFMPHHGSQSSNTQAWVQRIEPDIAIAQTGYRNRYHFPAKKVQQRYEKQGSLIQNTANGAVIISLQKNAHHTQQWVHVENQKQKLALQWWQRDL